MIARDIDSPRRDIDLLVCDIGLPLRDISILWCDIGSLTRDIGLLVRDIGSPMCDIGLLVCDMCSLAAIVGVWLRNDLTRFEILLGIGINKHDHSNHRNKQLTHKLGNVIQGAIVFCSIKSCKNEQNHLRFLPIPTILAYFANHSEAYHLRLMDYTKKLN